LAFARSERGILVSKKHLEPSSRTAVRKEDCLDAPIF
jgi:hypothetical protein